MSRLSWLILKYSTQLIVLLYSIERAGPLIAHLSWAATTQELPADSHERAKSSQQFSIGWLLGKGRLERTKSAGDAMLCTEYKGGECTKTVSSKKTSDIHRFYPAGAV